MYEIHGAYGSTQILEGIIHTYFNNNLIICEKMAQAIVADRKKLVGDAVYPGLLFTQNVVAVNREALHFLQSTEGCCNLCAKAFLVQDKINKLLFQQIIKRVHPQVPSRAFCSVQEAQQWLKTTFTAVHSIY